MALNLMIPMKLQYLVEHELKAGERVEWMGQPAAKFFTSKSVGICLFSLPLTAFAIFWIWAACGFKAPDLSKGFFAIIPLVFVSPFLLISLLMMLNPLFAYRKARNTVYAITNKRAIIYIHNTRMPLRSYSPEQLNEIGRREKGNGTGDVILNPKAIQVGPTGCIHSQAVAFRRIQDPHHVEAKLRELASRKTQQ